MKRQSMQTLAMLPLILLFTVAAAFGDEAPPLGEAKAIEITSNLRKRGSGWIYEFYMPIVQGDRYRFEVSPVGGAELKSRIRIIEDKPSGKDNKAFEESPLGIRHDWSMSKIPPGNQIRAQIVAYSLGKLTLRVSMVGEEVGSEDSSEIEALKRQLEEYRLQIEALKQEIESLKANKK